MGLLAQVLDEGNFEYLEQHRPELAKAIVAEVSSGATSSQIYSEVFRKSNNISLATRVASASDYVRLRDGAKQ